MLYESLKQETDKRLLCGTDVNALENDSDLIVFWLDHCEITVPEQNRFFVRVNCGDIAWHSYHRRAKPFRHLL